MWRSLTLSVVLLSVAILVQQSASKFRDPAHGHGRDVQIGSAERRFGALRQQELRFLLLQFVRLGSVARERAAD
jgi:hypothetical protein